MFKSQIESKLDAQIISALDELEGLETDSQKYATIMEHLTKLQKLKSEGKSHGMKPPSVDMMLAVGANLFGLLWLARYERSEVIKAPNAFRMIMRP